MDIYNRGGFSSGYYYMKNGKEMLANKRPNHTGTLIGKVEAVEAPFVYIRLERGIQAKDVLEIRTGTEQNIELTSNVTAQAGQKIRLNANNLRPENKDPSCYAFCFHVRYQETPHKFSSHCSSSRLLLHVLYYNR